MFSAASGSLRVIARTRGLGGGSLVCNAARAAAVGARKPLTLGDRSFSASSSSREADKWHGTTILCVRKGGKVVMIGDGQVSQGSMVVKGNARKVRRIGVGKDIIVGFAGATADAFTLVDRLERKLEEHSGQLMRSCVELAKAWRTDKYLRRLEAVLLVADSEVSYELTGTGDVLDPQHDCMGVGSGGPYALSAALALMDIEHLSAEEVSRKAMGIASELCVYTNTNYTIEIIDDKGKGAKGVVAKPEDAGDAPAADKP
eukprot:TRINITY_DN1945_c0_g1_i4.p1 TRINITY_DN1945_c0_g1~~TRINITY_DN1945_c0_g1_i4.p1  ORF type:complete len:259 (-),score=85.86 TRINITY_DN1945_c0_g1_i4:168-944(-)